MIRHVYSIFDSKVGIYTQPFHCIADGEALRAFSDAANAKDHYVGRHPADYTLMKIGNFNDETGRYIALDAFINLGNAQIFVVPKLSPAQIDILEKTELQE